MGSILVRYNVNNRLKQNTLSKNISIMRLVISLCETINDRNIHIVMCDRYIIMKPVQRHPAYTSPVRASDWARVVLNNSQNIIGKLHD